MSERNIDALIVTPPFSPFDAGPPLGPAVLKAHAGKDGLSVHTIDLNVRFLRLFQSGEESQIEIVGDHAKNRKRVEDAREFFRQKLHLPVLEHQDYPCCTDPYLGLPHDWVDVEHAFTQMRHDSFWQEFYHETLFQKYPAPRVLGISIMGPAQVLPALCLAQLVVQRWPGTLVVAGGSHITLLQNEIQLEQRYGQHIHAFLSGHSEQTLVQLLHLARSTDGKVRLKACDLQGVVSAGVQGVVRVPLPARKEVPVFERDELSLYASSRISIPVQFGKGCSYGRCTMCTYPAVEAFEKIKLTALARRFLPELQMYGVPRLSIKDSLFGLPSLRAMAAVNQELDKPWIWSATTKLLPGMNRSQMRELFSGGCRTLEFGVETIHPNMQYILDKKQPVELVDEVLAACIDAGIVVVINLIYGLPGETEAQALRQWEWFKAWHNRAPHLIAGSHNMLEVNRGSMMATNPAQYGIELKGIGPWSFSHRWNAPSWRPAFAKYLTEQKAIVEMERNRLV